MKGPLKTFTFSLFILLLVGSAWAQATSQQGLPLSGVIVDDRQQSVPFAAVALFRSSDSSAVDGTAADMDGRFQFLVPSNLYYLKISFLSYEPRLVPNIEVGQKPLRLGNLALESSALALDEVEISSTKSEMELNLDKRVFNVGADMRSAASSASEILDELPSVAVDVEGNVSLRGSQNVRILIDGKPSGLVGLSSTDALRQLPGDMIERVEVITNPSARYDAEGEAGIINIVLKKEKKKGYNGSVSLNTGYPERLGGSFNLNFRKKKVNYFASAGLNYRKTIGAGTSLQEFSQPDTAFYYKRNRDHDRRNFSGNGRFGADFTINDRNSITASVLFSEASGKNKTNIVYKDFSVSDVLTQTVTRTEDEDEDESNQEADLTYRKTFAQKDREWVTDLKYRRSEELEAASYEEVSDRNTVFPVSQRSENLEVEENIFVQSDYVHPFGENGKFETGVRGTFRDMSSDYQVDQVIDGEWLVLPAFNNNFLYTENIYAAYAMAGNKWKQISYQLGMRFEYSEVITELTETNVVNRREYPGWFPSAHLSYELSETQSMQLSYSRRLSRPGHWRLLPFYSFGEARNFYSGNPNLDPEYTNSFEAGYLLFGDKGSLLSSAYYRHRTEVIRRITLPVDSAGFTQTLPINLGIQDVFGMEFNLSYNLTDWWRLTTYFDFYHTDIQGSYEGESLDARAFTWSTRGNSRWSINKKTDVQLSYSYRAPMESSQGRQLSRYSIDISASREVLNGKGTVSINGRDLLNTRKRRSITEYEGFYSENEFQWQVRSFRINFNYRINQNKRGEQGDSRGGFGSGGGGDADS